MPALADLEALHRIALRHGFVQEAKLIAELISQSMSSPPSIWDALNTNDVWGGAGSLADISLAAYSPLPETDVKADELSWRNAFISLSEGMLANGRSNPRAETWASVFRSWNEAGIGI